MTNRPNFAADPAKSNPTAMPAQANPKPILATDPAKPAAVATPAPAQSNPPVQKPNADKASLTK